MLLGLLFLSSCSEPEPTVKQVETPESDKLVIFTWPDYIDMEVIAKFEEETGVEVEFSYFDSLSEMKALLRSKPGQFDLVLVDDFYLSELIDIQLLNPLKRELVPNITNIGNRFLDREFDPGNEYSVPYLWGSMLVAYRTDKVENPLDSWSILWDKAYAGRVGILEDKEEAYAVGLLSLGYPLNSNDPDQLSAATKKLVEHADTISPKYLELEDIKAQLVSGDLWIATCYSGDALTLAEEQSNIDYFIPSEGAPLWIDNFAIVKDAPNDTNAHRFINFMSRGEIAAQNASYLWTATPNEKAFSHLEQDFRDDETVYLSQQLFDKCDFYGLPTAFRDEQTNSGMKQILDKIHTSLTTQSRE